jgi:hypothetical protein
MGFNKPHILDNGTLIYSKRGWEPPPLVDGYRRKSDNPKSSDAWIMFPEWQVCTFRQRIQKQRENCKCVTFSHVCSNLHVIEKYGGQPPTVNLNICTNCEFCE